VSVIPLLPLFHKFNSQYFENSLAVNNQPLVKVRWSDNRLKTTAGFYKRKRINGHVDSEIILSKPILSKLSISEINSTLCHEMIHAWVDRILKKNEIHGPNFLEKMNEINEKEKYFQISVRHSFPIERRELKYIGTCQNCGEKFFYRKRIKNIACKKCCVNFFNGSWNKKCLILFDYKYKMCFCFYIWNYLFFNVIYILKSKIIYGFKEN